MYTTEFWMFVLFSLLLYPFYENSKKKKKEKIENCRICAPLWIKLNTIIIIIVIIIVKEWKHKQQSLAFSKSFTFLLTLVLYSSASLISCSFFHWTCIHTHIHTWNNLWSCPCVERTFKRFPFPFNFISSIFLMILFFFYCSRHSFLAILHFICKKKHTYTMHDAFDVRYSSMQPN